MGAAEEVRLPERLVRIEALAEATKEEEGLIAAARVIDFDVGINRAA
jgi:hypothetical protein